MARRRVEIGGEKVSVELVRRPRRSMELQIQGSGQLRVLVPRGLAEVFVLDALEQRADWIRKGLAAAAQREAAVRSKFLGGAQFSLLGEPLTLQLQPAAGPSVIVVQQENSLIVRGGCDDQDQVRQAVLEWYRVQARAHVIPRAHALAEGFGLQPRSIALSSAKKRWGSCSSRGSVRINTRCVMALPSIIDYVIVHELCHLTHLNHSPAFWALVQARQPDFRIHREWLKQHGSELLDW